MSDETDARLDTSIREHGEGMESDSHSEFNTRSIFALVGSASAMFCTVGFLNAFGIFVDWYHRHELSDRSTFDISWIGSFCTFMLFFSMAPAGILADRIGPTVPLVIGGVVLIFSMFLISFCKEYYQFFLVQGLLLAIGQAFLTCPVVAMISQHFHKRRGLASGLTIAGSSLGGIIWPIMINKLLNEDSIGFPWTMRSVAFTMLPLVVITCITIRTPAIRTPDTETDSMVDRPKKKKADFSLLKNGVFLTLGAGLGFFYLGMYSPVFFLTSYAVDIGVSTSFAFYLTSIFNAASLFGRVSAGVLADRYGCFNITSVAALGSAAVGFCWTLTSGTGSLVVWSLAYGFTSGCILSLQIQCATKLATPSTYGTSVGLILAIVSLTGLFGSPVAGALLKYSYFALSMYTGATLLVGAILICVSRLQLSRKLYESV